MELIKFAVSVLLLITVWGAWRRSALDRARDNLFDMRESLRVWFIQNGYGLDHAMYANLRELLNAHLRFTEEVRFIGMLWFASRTPASIAEAVRAELNTRYQTKDSKLSELATQVRHDSARTMQKYMMATSTLFTVSVMMVLPFVLLSSIRKDLHEVWLNTKRAIAERLDEGVANQHTIEVAATLQAA